MPTLTNHQSNQFTKTLLIGDSGSGKTGSLASLVAVGYKLRILDMDNGLDVLKSFVAKQDPTLLSNVEFVTLRDKRETTSAGPVIKKPQAFITAVKLLDRWRYGNGDDEVNLGIPSEWGSDVILVIDSLTMLSEAAYYWREPLTPRGRSGDYDKRATFYDAQKAVEEVLALLTSEWFRTNVIVIAHVKYIDNPDGSRKGYPLSVGSALSPRIPAYFNSVALAETKGGKRRIKTIPTSMIDLKNPKPFDMADEYPLDTGMAAFFSVLRDPIFKGENIPCPTSPQSSTPPAKTSSPPSPFRRGRTSAV